jgi:hypothetical protein
VIAYLPLERVVVEYYNNTRSSYSSNNKIPFGSYNYSLSYFSKEENRRRSRIAIAMVDRHREVYNKSYSLAGVKRVIQPAVPDVLTMTTKGCRTVWYLSIAHKKYLLRLCCVRLVHILLPIYLAVHPLPGRWMLPLTQGPSGG